MNAWFLDSELSTCLHNDHYGLNLVHRDARYKIGDEQCQRYAVLRTPVAY